MFCRIPGPLSFIFISMFPGSFCVAIVTILIAVLLQHVSINKKIQTTNRVHYECLVNNQLPAHGYVLVLKISVPEIKNPPLLRDGVYQTNVII